ncbi:YdcF family protein [Pontibacter sp. E15-1]|uniref:YdcF family protein n=1 Tax=Pontibacter sp. E15-1 TaxID=2919918 RepID=UPI001F4F1513|nr:YdcF family protein [Pontibacter sp. E15-1]MCJ8164458.1 YdcF family protein [Pontibacter sp. E15-1]
MAIPADQHRVSLLNTLIRYLARRDLRDLTAEALQTDCHLQQVDLLILLGNSSLFVAEQAARAYRFGLAKEMMICGGIGHSTHFLEANIRQHPRYNDVAVGGRPEADMLQDLLAKHLQVSPETILLENHSTNCGDNARQALRVLKKLQKTPESILLLQDPVLQRRSQASFEKVWQYAGARFISYAAFVPLLQSKEGMLAYATAAHREFCDLDRLLSLVLGEIPRLRNDAAGYGPKGKGYITAIPIPAEVEAAHAELASLYPMHVRV